MTVLGSDMFLRAQDLKSSCGPVRRRQSAPTNEGRSERQRNHSVLCGLWLKIKHTLGWLSSKLAGFLLLTRSAPESQNQTACMWRISTFIWVRAHRVVPRSLCLLGLRQVIRASVHASSRVMLRPGELSPCVPPARDRSPRAQDRRAPWPSEVTELDQCHVASHAAVDVKEA